MSKCSACEDLRNDAPNFVLGGVTTEACTSLKNNTGFNPSLSPTNDNCTDLDNANECLVGNMADQVEAYDVCEWKDYMRKFVPNVYTVLKAMICSDCGEWTNIEALISKADDLCKLINSNIAPPLVNYGVHPLSTRADVGTAVTSRVQFHADDGTLNPYIKSAQGIGISYGSLKTTDCVSGKCTVYEWIQPQIFYTYIKEGVKEGDVLWYATKEQIQSASSFSDHLWQVFTESSWTWSDAEISNGASRGKGVELKITVNPGGMGNNYIGVVYRGTTYPNESTTSYDFYPGAIGDVPRLYTHRCE